MVKNSFSAIILDIVKHTEQGECSRYLDIGCGNGDVVADLLNNNIDAYGCDVEFKEGDKTEQLWADKKIKKIVLSGQGREDVMTKNPEYSYPYPDSSFCVVFSRAVLEHVFNHNEFASENSRVLSDKGVAIHYFPSKYSIVECHTGIPFGAFVQNLTYYRLMCAFGLCFAKYKGKPNDALLYMKNYTNYLSNKELIKTFERHGFNLVSRPTEKILLHFRNGRFKALSKIPFFLKIWSMFRTEILVFSLEKKG